MKTDVDPTVDYAFKMVYGTEAQADVLAHLLNAVTAYAEGKRARTLALRNPFTAKGFAADKATVLDIRATDQAGRQYHVEMQALVPWSFDKRLLYYWARAHAQQLLEGDYYETLCPTVSVAFLGQKLFGDAVWHHKVGLWDQRHGQLLSKDLEIHVIELPKFTLAAESCLTPLERWCYFLRHGAELDPDHLPATLDEPVYRKAVEVLRMLGQNEQERIRYEMQLKARLDAGDLQHRLRLAEKAEQRARDAEQHVQDVERRARDAEQHVRDVEQRARDVEQRARDAERQAEDAKRQAEDAKRFAFNQGEMIGQIHAYQMLLKQPLTPRDELLRLTADELAARAKQFVEQLVPKANGTAQP